MKLWDVLATCFLLLSTASTNPLSRNLQSAQTSSFPGQLGDVPSLPLDKPESEPESNSAAESVTLQESSTEEHYETNGPFPEEYEEVMELIQATIRRLRRSPEKGGGGRGRRGRDRQRSPANRGGREDKKGRGRRKRGGRGRNRGCVLKQVHLNVTDLGLGYRTKEEMIFRYCSGPCVNSETNYDKILNNLTHNKKLEQDPPPARACCRPTAFDDDLSFLDDSLTEYHTLKRHSAKRCGCV
ncbi:LOW QUALITY PROTEIN: glial cell line-derived neurotrophic factor-like [Anguilla rostrata]|uniref:LOW QUALITY PROTEIN: glial cell line-derived neurotrophic factor-like n=1 Tax=Anguilla rostrata TaxID=7938 RepID=UPI0030CAC2B5